MNSRQTWIQHQFIYIFNNLRYCVLQGRNKFTGTVLSKEKIIYGLINFSVPENAIYFLYHIYF